MKKAINCLFSVLPKGAMKSVTSNRRKEFACHNRIKNELKIDFFFADAYALWQRGSNENVNGLLREFYPKQTNLSRVTQEELRQKLEIINNRPRKYLNWTTPIEVFLQEVCTWIDNSAIKKIIECFSMDLTATATSEILGLNRKTVNKYFGEFRELILKDSIQKFQKK